VSRTPSVCVPTDTDLVFIKKGRCVADIVNVRTREVLRKLRTLVVGNDITLLQVGNATVTLAPIYFERMSAVIDSKGIATLQLIKQQAFNAGSILIIGHSGTLNGNSLPNQQIANARALAAMSALKEIGAKGVFATSSIGALAPSATGNSEKAQRQNRRVVLALIP
jgi:outer membrane protein OmpA-like peptidoglycan-associated protein